MVAKTLLTNRPAQIAIAVILVLAVVYFMGRNAGKNAQKQSWWQRLFGGGDETAPVDIPAPVTVGGQVPAENVQYITDAIYQGFHNHRWYGKNGENINLAFAQFNASSQAGKASVVNDWNARYFGTDRPGYFTGDYGTIRQEIAEVVDEGLLPQTALAYKWLQDLKIQ